MANMKMHENAAAVDKILTTALNGKNHMDYGYSVTHHFGALNIFWDKLAAKCSYCKVFTDGWTWNGYVQVKHLVSPEERIEGIGIVGIGGAQIAYFEEKVRHGRKFIYNQHLFAVMWGDEVCLLEKGEGALDQIAEFVITRSNCKNKIPSFLRRAN